MSLDSLFAARAARRRERALLLDEGRAVVEKMDAETLLDFAEYVVAKAAAVDGGNFSPPPVVPEEPAKPEGKTEADAAHGNGTNGSTPHGDLLALLGIDGPQTIRQMIINTLGSGPPRTTGDLLSVVRTKRPDVKQNTVGADVKRLKDLKLIFEVDRSSKGFPRYALSEQGRKEFNLNMGKQETA